MSANKEVNQYKFVSKGRGNQMQAQISKGHQTLRLEDLSTCWTSISCQHEW